MLELRIITAGQPLAPHALFEVMERPAARAEIGDQIEALIALLDADDDPDMEDSETSSELVDDRGRFIGNRDLLAYNPGLDDDLEPHDDDKDFAWFERVDQSKPGGRGKSEFIGIGTQEDAEEDDAAEDDEPDSCDAGDDGVYAGAPLNSARRQRSHCPITGQPFDMIGDDVDAEYDNRDAPKPVYLDDQRTMVDALAAIGAPTRDFTGLARVIRPAANDGGRDGRD